MVVVVVVGELARQRSTCAIIFFVGPNSNWFAVCGVDPDTKQGHISVRLMLGTNKRFTEQMQSTAKGITFTPAGWQTIIDLLDKIDKTVDIIEDCYIDKE